MRARFAILLCCVVCLSGYPPGVGLDGCAGPECDQGRTTCDAGLFTSISGTVFAPNGTLPLPNVTVYVPKGPVQPFPAAISCDRCDRVLGGDPLVQTTSDVDGSFTLDNVPAGRNVPLVIQTGRWRRQLVVPNVPACVTTRLAANETRLPKNRTEGDIPRLALSTGAASAMECLLRKVGLEDSEFGTAAGPQRIHLYAGTGGADAFKAGGAFASAPRDLWRSLETLQRYDLIFLSCEGAQNAGSKPTAALQALADYTARGGRVFASHYQSYWLQAGPGAFPQTATFVDNPDLDFIQADVATGFERGATLAAWLLKVGAATTPGTVDIGAAQHSVAGVNADLATRWIYKEITGSDAPSVQLFSFTTPLGVPAAQRCGRFVFSDIHASSADRSSPDTPFPTGCATSAMSPQEKVLAFMLFDIGSCAAGRVE
jgi:hypothetical protein